MLEGKIMHLMIDPVETAWGGRGETAWLEEAEPDAITTTLYDLIAAVRAAVARDETRSLSPLWCTSCSPDGSPGSVTLRNSPGGSRSH